MMADFLGYAFYPHLSAASSSVTMHRKFLETNYKPIKQSNPDLPFLVREAQGTPARAFARFGTYLFTTEVPRHGTFHILRFILTPSLFSVFACMCEP